MKFSSIKTFFEKRQELNELLQRKEKEKTYQSDLFNDYFDNKKEEDFIPYSVLENQFLLDNNISKKSSTLNQIINERDSYFRNYNQVKFSNFTVGWTRDQEFSLTRLIPAVYSTANQPHNVLTFDFSYSDNPELQELLTKYNQKINQYLEDGYLVEVLPNVVVLYDASSKAYEIF
ncbi:MSC_0623 family F1-like ATPase-associated protein, partial [Mycoplasma nasistruthionis]|uniref:MSC_0623 family F1-like ATPase-associated protein n=1 Tax=Mycoplasma nasistruthionis TaxID=353852 RepID=UPI001ABF8075